MKILVTENQLKYLIGEQGNPKDSIADNIWNSVKGLGTDEEEFYNIISQIKDQSTLNLVSKNLTNKYGQSFYDIVNEPLEFSDDEKNKIIEILNKNNLPHNFIKGKIVPKPIPPSIFSDVSKMSSTPRLFEFLKHEEGSPKEKGKPMLTAYKRGKDKATIGYGHTEGVRLGMKIDEKTAIKFLKQDILSAEGCIKRAFAEWKANGNDVKITQSMFDTLVSLAFNAGCGNLRGTDEDMDEVIDNVRNKNFARAAEKIKTSFLRDGFSGLINRRKKESTMFCEQGGCKGTT